MRTASWVLLTILGVLVLGIGLLSSSLAYRSPDDDLLVPGTSMTKLEAPDDIKIAIRARRGTAAAYGVAFATLFLFIVLGPYKRGEIWSWWALLTALLVLNVVVLLRIPLLGTQAGVGPGLTLLGVGVLGLLLDVGRLRRV